MSETLMARLMALRTWRFQTGHFSMLFAAMVIGVGGGFAAVGFRLLIQGMNGVFWGAENPTLDFIRDLPWWWKIAAPTVGGLIAGFLVYKFAPEAKGHGVPEVMEAVAIRGGRIRPRVVLVKMFASGVSIASGGSVGREGPIVQIGSAMGSTLGQWLGIDRRGLRTLVGCGAAAGIAGTFNAPVAGALFAVEIILGNFGVAMFSPIVVASVMATVVSHYFLGDVPAFVVPAYSLVSAQELVAYAGLGLAAGFTGLAFVRILYASEDLFDRIRVYPPLLAAGGFALVGVIGLWLPQVFGVGYEAIEDALRGDLVWHVMLLLVVAKILAVSITIGAGGSGGIFAPSLFIGAMLGGAVGALVHTIWPDATGTPGAYALVGMGAVVAAGTHAPITAILIIFELTGDYAIILPLMIACIIGTVLATRLQKASIYTEKLLRRGIDIAGGRDVNVLNEISVRDTMRTDMATVSLGDNLSAILARLIDHAGSSLFVTDENDRLQGVITADMLRPIMQDASALEGLLIAQDIMIHGKMPTVEAHHSLADVMRHLGAYRGEVPVLEDNRLVGVMWPEDVIERYNTEIFKRDTARSMASSLGADSRTESIPMLEGSALAEVAAPASFVGRTLAELDIRRRLDVSVLLIKQEGADGRGRVEATPAADYVFRAGDIMLVMGSRETVDLLRRRGV